jgi:hypothetical protein
MKKIVNSVRTCFLILLLLLAALAPQLAFSNPKFSIVRIDSKTIKISGPILEPMFRHINDVLTPETSIIQLAPEGVDTPEASKVADIAELMMARKMGLVVDGVCLSSCANYLFVAAETRKVLSGSVVGWHGGYSNAKTVLKEDLVDVMRRHALLKREQLIYLKKGVSLDLIIYSAYLTNANFSVDSVGQTIRQREFDLWVPTKNTLESLGVKNLTMESDFLNAAAVESALAKHGADNVKVFAGLVHSYLPVMYRDK